MSLPSGERTRPEGLEEKVERAAEHVVRARLFFDVWYYLESAGNDPARLNALNQFSAYFRFDLHAHLIAFVVYIHGLFEKNGASINLNRLTRELKGTGRISEVDLREIDELLAQAAPIVKKVKSLRDKAIAHRTASTSYNDVFRSAEVTYKELSRLTELARDIVNRLLKSIKRKGERFHSSPLNDLEALVRVLAKSARTGEQGPNV